MEEAIAIAELIDKQLIVFTKIKKGKYKKHTRLKKGGFETGKVFVLQNENSSPRVKSGWCDSR
jgi:carboxyl-terminal processing protease